jgi:hypothetical protein
MSLFLDYRTSTPRHFSYAAYRAELDAAVEQAISKVTTHVHRELLHEQVNEVISAWLDPVAPGAPTWTIDILLGLPFFSAAGPVPQPPPAPHVQQPPIRPILAKPPLKVAFDLTVSHSRPKAKTDVEREAPAARSKVLVYKWNYAEKPPVAEDADLAQRTHTILAGLDRNRIPANYIAAKPRYVDRASFQTHVRARFRLQSRHQSNQ